MRKIIFCLCLAGSLVFCLFAKAVQAQNSYKVVAATAHAQGGSATSHKLPCSYFETLPADIQRFIDRVVKCYKKTGEDFYLPHAASTKEWNEQDFFKIANNEKSLGIAMNFADIADAAYELTPDGKSYTENALCVQKIMYQLKPDCCPSLDDFYTMIAKNCKRSAINKQMQQHR